MTLMNSLEPFFEQQGFAMLDGGLSTQLERRGADLSGALWTARVLIDDPDAITLAHTDFLHGGADIIATATYQASTEGLENAGLSTGAAEQLMRGAVALAVDARDRFWSDSSNREHRLKPLVATSLGPYGACLHDGSEYHGNYDAGRQKLFDFHERRIALLEHSGADLFAFETIPSLEEGEVILSVLESFPDIRAWISFTGRDEWHIVHGERFSDCVEHMAVSPQMLAVGVNCTAPENIPGLLTSVEKKNVPLAVYPNSGERWDAEGKEWCGDACGAMDVVRWHGLGARLVGGCCRTDASDIRRMRKQLDDALS